MLSRFFLDRPVFAWVIAIIMMLAGALAIYNLPISQYPPIAPPSISIQAIYPGASAKTVEDSVVQIIEQKMTGLDRMLYMSATSDSSGSANITLTFAPGTDPDLAWAKVQNKLQLALPSLPDVVQSRGLTVSKSTRNYLLLVGLTSDDPKITNEDLSDYVVSKVESVIARVPGVGETQVLGSGYAMRIWLDPDKLTQYGMTPADVIAAVRAYNVEVSAGQFGGMPAVPGQRLNASILIQSLLVTPEEFAAIPVRTNADGSVVRVSDVGRTELGTELADIKGQFNGRPSAMLAIRQEAGANALETAAGIKAAMANLSKYFPAGMKVIYPMDTTPFVRVAINEVFKTLDRGDLPGLPGDVPLPRQLPRDADPDDRRAGRAPGHLRRPVGLRLLDQHADDVRHGPRHRSARRRRHRRRRERRARDERGGPAALGGDAQVDGRDLERARRHRPGPGGGLRSDDVLPGLDRRHLPPVLGDGHRLDAALGPGGLDPDARPVRHVPAARREGPRGRGDRFPPAAPVLPLVRSRLQRWPRTLRADRGAHALPQGALRRRVRRDRRPAGRVLRAHAHRLPSRRGPGDADVDGLAAHRLDARADAGRHRPGGGLLQGEREGGRGLVRRRGGVRPGRPRRRARPSPTSSSRTGTCAAAPGCAPRPSPAGR